MTQINPDAPPLRTAGEWLAAIQTFDADTRRRFVELYGPPPDALQQRRGLWLKVLSAFCAIYGESRRVVVCRAPGRINLMGRHVDHRGGHVNPIAIGREVVAIASPRDDRRVRLRNVEAAAFPTREFGMQDFLCAAAPPDWLGLITGEDVTRHVSATRGDWGNYARAAVMRLQYEFSDIPLRGFDCMVHGDIPRGAGLSSSSALVVAAAEITIRLNGLSVPADRFVDLCGEGEWFVGSRGGSADHAAIRTCALGHVSRLGFFPFRNTGCVPVPDSLRVVIADSGEKAAKSAGARDVFNQRVACYEFAQILLRRGWAPAAGIERLRDVAPAALGVSGADLYRALKLLPTHATHADLPDILGSENHARMEEVLATHAEVGPYNIRGTALYGIAECLRSARFADALRGGDMARIGQFMRASHDGDRRYTFDREGQCSEFNVPTGDADLDQLARADAELVLQSGTYGCSTKSIDFLVDLAAAMPGVLGGQIAGAGLGGCVIIISQEFAVGPLLDRLHRQYYEPRGLPPGAYVCTPVAGGGVVDAKG